MAAEDPIDFIPPLCDLHEMIQAFARDAVTTQMIFDQEYREQQELAAAVLRQAPSQFRELLLSVAPSRMCLRTMDVELRTRVLAQRKKGFGIQVFPVNIGYDVRYGSTATSETRFRLSIEQIPLAPSKS